MRACVRACVLASCMNTQPSLQPHGAVCSDQSDASVQFAQIAAKADGHGAERATRIHPSAAPQHSPGTRTRARAHTHGFSCSFLLLLYLFLFSLVHTPPLLPFSSLSLLATLSHPVLSLLSSPLFLFLFPLHSLMLELAQQTDPRSETGGAGPCKLSITGCWPMGAENLLSHVLQ